MFGTNAAARSRRAVTNDYCSAGSAVAVSGALANGPDKPGASDPGQQQMKQSPPDRAMNIESPCINVCRMRADTGYCEGCFRSLDEIARWSGSADAEKLRILAAAERRRAALATPTQIRRAGGLRR